MHAAFADVAPTERVQHPARGGSHGAGNGAEDGDEEVERPGDGQGDVLGVLQGDGLGDDLAQDDVQVGDDGEGKDGGQGVGEERAWGRRASGTSSRRAMDSSPIQPRARLAMVTPI